MSTNKTSIDIVAREVKEDLEQYIRDDESKEEDRKKKKRTNKWKQDLIDKNKDEKYRQ